MGEKWSALLVGLLLALMVLFSYNSVFFGIVGREIYYYAAFNKAGLLPFGWLSSWYFGTPAGRFLPPLLLLIVRAGPEQFFTQYASLLALSSIFAASCLLYAVLRKLGASRASSFAGAVLFASCPTVIASVLFDGHIPFALSSPFLALFAYLLLTPLRRKMRIAVLSCALFSLLVIDPTSFTVAILFSAVLYGVAFVRGLPSEVPHFDEFFYSAWIGGIGACFWLIPASLSPRIIVSPSMLLGKVPRPDAMLVLYASPWEARFWLGYALVFACFFSLAKLVKKEFWSTCFLISAIFCVILAYAPFLGITGVDPLSAFRCSAFFLSLLGGLGCSSLEEAARRAFKGKYLAVALVSSVVILSALQAYNQTFFSYKLSPSERSVALWISSNAGESERVYADPPLSQCLNAYGNVPQVDGGMPSLISDYSIYRSFYEDFENASSPDQALQLAERYGIKYFALRRSTYASKRDAFSEPYFHIVYKSGPYIVLEVNDSYASVSYVEATPDSVLAWVEKRPNEIVLHVYDVPGECYLLVKESYYPTWKVYPSSGEASVERSEEGFLLICLKAEGDVDVFLRNELTALDYGSTASIPLALAIYAFTILPKKPKPKPSRGYKY